METLELILHELTNIVLVLFELMGVVVITFAGIRGILDYIKRNPQIRLNLAKGMALGLEFKLGSEILRTVLVRDAKEIATVAGIIALRAALTFLIHWEISAEEEDHSEDAAAVETAGAKKGLLTQFKTSRENA